MKRFSFLVVLAIGFLFGTQCALATTLVVGTCHPGTHFTTISAAVAAAPAGATVVVCPGTYPEQVIISTPLNLTGITSGNLGRATIAFPAAGLGITVTSVNNGHIVVGPQVLVTIGPVNITNITVDGTGNNLNGTGEDLAGIFYESGASGTLNGVLAREQHGCGCGVGIWAENGNSTSESVTIENSQIHDADSMGIFAASSIDPPTLVATVVGNQIINSTSGIVCGFLTGTIMSNVVVDHGAFGIITSGSRSSIGNNTISASLGSSNTTGIQVSGTAEIVKSNTILNENGPTSGIGINVAGASGATVEANKMTDGKIGIEFGCTAGNTVSGNTINGMGIGLDNVPKGQNVPGTYHNEDALRGGGC